MMESRGTITPMKVSAPVIDMCYFPMLTGSIREPLLDERIQVREISEIVNNRLKE